MKKLISHKNNKKKKIIKKQKKNLLPIQFLNFCELLKYCRSNSLEKIMFFFIKKLFVKKSTTKIFIFTVLHFFKLFKLTTKKKQNF